MPRTRWRDREVRVASVATGFPCGQTFLDIKIEETRQAAAAGATRSTHGHRPGRVPVRGLRRGLRRDRGRQGGRSPTHLKVILETGELETYDNVRRASILAMAAGADFIKTSTGKVVPAATLPVTLVMLEAIRDFETPDRPRRGHEAAGGIRTAKEAIAYLVVLYETLPGRPG